MSKPRTPKDRTVRVRLLRPLHLEDEMGGGPLLILKGTTGTAQEFFVHRGRQTLGVMWDAVWVNQSLDLKPGEKHPGPSVAFGPYYREENEVDDLEVISIK